MGRTVRTHTPHSTAQFSSEIQQAMRLGSLFQTAGVPGYTVVYKQGFYTRYSVLPQRSTDEMRREKAMAAGTPGFKNECKRENEGNNDRMEIRMRIEKPEKRIYQQSKA